MIAPSGWVDALKLLPYVHVSRKETMIFYNTLLYFIKRVYFNEISPLKWIIRVIREDESMWAGENLKIGASTAANSRERNHPPPPHPPRERLTENIQQKISQNTLSNGAPPSNYNRT